MPDLRFTRDVLLLSCGGCGDERHVDRTRGAEATALDTLSFCDAHLGCPTGSVVVPPVTDDAWREGDHAQTRARPRTTSPRGHRAG
jgi:hypothetical protein